MGGRAVLQSGCTVVSEVTNNHNHKQQSNDKLTMQAQIHLEIPQSMYGMNHNLSEREIGVSMTLNGVVGLRG